MALGGLLGGGAAALDFVEGLIAGHDELLPVADGLVELGEAEAGGDAGGDGAVDDLRLLDGGAELGGDGGGGFQ